LSALAKQGPRSVIARLALTVAGLLLTVGPPYAFVMLNLTGLFQRTVIAGIELACLVVGLVLLYIAFKES
jgi:hypothetical protein